MEEHALIGVFAVVVVPIHQSGRFFRRHGEGIHGNRAGYVHFAGGRQQFVAHHAHQRAGVDAQILLNGIPALQRGGSNILEIHPLFQRDGELGHAHDWIVGNAFGGDVAVDFIQLGFDFLAVILHTHGLAD